MILKSLSVQNIRVHGSKKIDFISNPTLIAGPNGSGKTSLIEAIYIALRGKSFRGGDDTVCKEKADYYRIILETDTFAYSVRYGMVKTKKTRQFIVDDKKYTRLPYKLKYPIVLFEPEDLRIINGSPSRRRNFIDTLIQQYDPLYSREVSRYERALQQRNKLLKISNISDDDLFPWSVILSESGAKIIQKRSAAIVEFNKTITDIYRDIAATDDVINLNYSHKPLSNQTLLREYTEKISYDKAVGATSIGPHRHDFAVLLNNKNAAQTASRGEMRTIVLALKFLEASYIEKMTQTKPLILLDDVFGELDQSRQAKLMQEFTNNQIIMTSANSYDAILGKSVNYIELS